MPNAENTTDATKTVRKSYVVTFANHPPIRLWGDFEEDGKSKYLGDFEDDTLWNKGQQWGFCDVCYYICKSGKRLYWGSYNSGESYGGRDSETTRTFLNSVVAIKRYIEDHGGEAEWNRVSHKVDVNVIVDSDLL